MIPEISYDENRIYLSSGRTDGKYTETMGLEMPYHFHLADVSGKKGMLAYCPPTDGGVWLRKYMHATLVLFAAAYRKIFVRLTSADLYLIDRNILNRTKSKVLTSLNRLMLLLLIEQSQEWDSCF